MKNKPDLIECSCGNSFRPVYDYRTGIIKSKKCPSCQFKKVYGRSNLNTSNSDIKKTTKSRKKSSKSLAMERADKYFSRYIRLKHSFVSNGRVICKCIVSDSIHDILKIDNGHFFSRYHKSTRYHEDNCRPQSKSSNRYRGEADKSRFEENLIKQIGKERFNSIKILYKELGRDSEDYYNEIANKYRELVKSEIKKIGINPWCKKY